MPVIERDGKAPLILHAPSDRALGSLWELAQMEFTARDGQDPVTHADWATVTARYHALVTERRGDLGAVIRETREAATTSARPPVQLRAWLTPFGEQIAAVLEPRSPVLPDVRWRVVPPSEAVEVMRHVLTRHGLETQFALQNRTWYETPDIFIRIWTSTESVIVIQEDAAGPIELRFLTRIAADTVKAVMRIGHGPVAFGLRRALWDVGIRRMVGELPTSTPPRFLQQIRDLGVTLHARGDGWLEYTDVLTKRPDAETSRAWLAQRPTLRPDQYAAQFARERAEGQRP